jgi:hypothetical protein
MEGKMEAETQKFLEAEQTAEKLVSTLQQLHTEATSYRTATGELETVRQRLISMIEVMQQTAVESHKAIIILNEMGGPEIIQHLNLIENKMSQDSELKSKQLKKLTTLVLLALIGVSVSSILSVIILLIK